MLETKPFVINKQQVTQAYKLVKAKAGSSGVDEQTLAEFDENLKDNLYKIWNRMSSGSYYPQPVKAVSIPKKDGGKRILGIPTVSDRIAQTVVKLEFEPKIEPIFYPDSYGYRPNKSALDAVGVTRKRCWKYDYVVEFDIKGLFDNIDHELLMKAIRKHTQNKWVILYIERWLKAPILSEEGELVKRTKGTPQGGVISPVISNLFLHYVFDVWISKEYSHIPWCRYADDGLIHCKTESQAKLIMIELNKRFKSCKLELHEEKTKIIYCKDGLRKAKYKNTSFTFLGYDFRQRTSRNRGKGNLFMNFTPGVSKDAIKAMCNETRQSNIRNRTDINLEDIAKIYNPVIRGWIEYYGCYNKAALYPVLRHFNMTLVSWAKRKFKKLKASKAKAGVFIRNISKRNAGMFAHWKLGIACTFA